MVAASVAPRGAAAESAWNAKFSAYAKQHPALAAELKRRLSGELPASWKQHAAAVLASVNAKAETIATRKASQNAIEALAPALPELAGGSADLAGSNLTWWSGSKAVGGALSDSGGGNYILFGVREFGMSAIANGMALRLSNVTKDTPNPNGGEILRDKDGNPTGLLRERASGLIRRGAGEPAPTAEEIATRNRRVIELADQEVASKGITSFHDAGTGFGTVDRYKAAIEAHTQTPHYAKWRALHELSRA